MRTKARVIEGTQGEALYSVTAIEDVTDVKRAEFSHRLLARSGELLSHSTDYRRTLERVPHLVVPEFADWCAVEMPGPESRLRRVASAHRDPKMFEHAERMRERYPVFVDDDDAPVGHVMRTGVAQRFDLTEEQLSAIATDESHLEELRALAIRSAVVAPMSAGGSVVGALVLVNHIGSRAFDDEDLAVAVELAQRAALAIENARLAEERTRVADALQRELLPPSLPRMPGWQVATMYEPAGEINQVGGDFYEVFPVEGGWAVVLGDVSGKGAAAAALTAEARHTIRTAGVLSDDPRRGFYLLDDNLRERDDAALCSAAMVVVPADPEASSEVTVYLAGHPHPMLMHEGEATPVGDPGPMLGVVDDPVWEGVTVTIEPGDQLVLYTDGVIEARGRDGERFGEERLRHGLAGSTTPDSAVEQVRGALDGFGAEGRQDDAAVVVVRRRPAAGASASRLGVASAPADHTR
jgi:serine phosphatase RsbU (regulator of sigma subunit)